MFLKLAEFLCDCDLCESPIFYFEKITEESMTVSKK